VIVDGVRAMLCAGSGVVDVPRLEVVVVGPRTWLVTGEVAVDGSLPGAAVTALIGDLRDRLRAEPGIAGVYLSPVPPQATQAIGRPPL
jgi:hypothetical protein